jgi:hypothetical protein
MIVLYTVVTNIKIQVLSFVYVMDVYKQACYTDTDIMQLIYYPDWIYVLRQ